MKKNILIFSLSILLFACNKETVDTIIINSNTYTVNDNFDKTEAFAIKDGKFIAVGTSKEIKKKIRS